MKLYTEEEVRKMHRSFIKILEENKIPTCNIHSQLYHPTPIEVQLAAQIIPTAKPAVVFSGASVSYECPEQSPNEEIHKKILSQLE